MIFLLLLVDYCFEDVDLLILLIYLYFLQVFLRALFYKKYRSLAKEGAVDLRYWNDGIHYFDFIGFKN